MTLRSGILTALFCIACLCVNAQNKSSAPYENAGEVFSAIQKRYKGNKWYRHFTFSQETVFYDKEGKEERKEIWHEASSSPGKLLIKFGSKDSKNGVLLESGKIHVYREGKEPIHRTGLHDLSVAAFDVYFVKPERSAQILDSIGYNTKLVRTDEFEGRKSIVIGAEKGDTLSRQIWYDADRLYIQRIIYLQGKTVMDAVFAEYQQLNKGKDKKYWVATKMIFRQNGVLGLVEKYYDIRFPEKFSEDTFDPVKFNVVKLD